MLAASAASARSRPCISSRRASQSRIYEEKDSTFEVFVENRYRSYLFHLKYRLVQTGQERCRRGGGATRLPRGGAGEDLEISQM